MGAQQVPITTSATLPNYTKCTPIGSAGLLRKPPPEVTQVSPSNFQSEQGFPHPGCKQELNGWRTQTVSSNRNKPATSSSNQHPKTRQHSSRWYYHFQLQEADSVQEVDYEMDVLGGGFKIDPVSCDLL